MRAKTLLPGEIKKKVLSIIRSMRPAGCVVNYNITTSIAKGTVLTHDSCLLKDNGGNLQFHYSWSQSIFCFLGFSKCRATTARSKFDWTPNDNRTEKISRFSE